MVLWCSYVFLDMDFWRKYLEFWNRLLNLTVNMINLKGIKYSAIMNFIIIETSEPLKFITQSFELN